MPVKRNDIIPLSHLAIEIIVDGVRIRGEIVRLYPNDIEVEITEPFDRLRTGLHVPYFAMYESNWLATAGEGATTAITERGERKAEWLLRCLYDYARGFPVSWSVYRQRRQAGRVPRIGTGRMNDERDGVD